MASVGVLTKPQNKNLKGRLVISHQNGMDKNSSQFDIRLLFWWVLWPWNVCGPNEYWLAKHKLNLSINFGDIIFLNQFNSTDGKAARTRSGWVRHTKGQSSLVLSTKLWFDKNIKTTRYLQFRYATKPVSKPHNWIQLSLKWFPFNDHWLKLEVSTTKRSIQFHKYVEYCVINTVGH